MRNILLAVVLLASVRAEAQDLSGRYGLLEYPRTLSSDLNLLSGKSIYLYNTTDLTNYERMALYWSGNNAYLQMQKGGTGTARNLNFLANDSTGLQVSGFAVTTLVGSSSGIATVVSQDGVGMSIAGRVTTSTSVAGIVLSNLTFGTPYSAASGTQTHLNVPMVVNQSATAGYDALAIAVTETLTGSGTKRLINATVGGNTKFSVANDGDVTTVGSIATTIPTLVSVDASTTFAVTANVISIDCVGAETLTTATGGVSGMILTLLFKTDADVCTVTDTSAETANTFNIGAAFTSTQYDTLTFVHDGTKWYEIGRSVN